MIESRGWLIGVLALSACGSSPKVDLVRFAVCADCEPIAGQPARPVATYAYVPVATAWYSMCHSDAPNGQDGLVGECRLVENEATFSCPDGRCTIGATTPEPVRPGEQNGNTRRTDVMIAKPGRVTMTATLTPKRSGGTPYVESFAITAVVPDQIAAGCTYEPGVVFVELFAKGEQLLGEARQLEVQITGGGRCERVDATDQLKNQYRCPLTAPAASIEVRDPDFSMTTPLVCAP